ncbi:MAG: hypothetical protein GF320_18320 [Armatimonadia bacterium]|nr:hypothetical protein [Armatimonadia bacterium]
MAELQEHHSGRRIPYSDAELLDYGPPETLTGERLNQIAFPLGGIGTGCVSLSGRGELIDWEIFGRPNKGYRPSYTSLLLQMRPQGDDPALRVVEGELAPPYTGRGMRDGNFRGSGFGPPREFLSGFLRYRECGFTGAFPFARVDLRDPAVPVSATIEAWSPFIPLQIEDSSIPAAVLDVTLVNESDAPMEITLAMGLENIVGWPEEGGCRTEWRDSEHWRGLSMSTSRHDPDSPRYGSLALMTPHKQVTYQTRFGSAEWFGISESLLFDFGETGRFGGPTEPAESPDGQAHVAHMGLVETLAPGEPRRLTFVLGWLTPNFEHYWGGGEVWKTHHGRLWWSAVEVASYVVRHIERLRDGTRAFRETFDETTMPRYVLDAVSSQMSILNSPTVTRLPDGTLYGFEGCHATSGCCSGSCTHVWSYAQTMAYLFPRLERGMRTQDYEVNLRESDGHMQFRLPLPPGAEADHEFHAAADGQMGGVLRTYREWLISGDDEWLRGLWPKVRKALEYAWVAWDPGRVGLLEGVHHNTLDIEYHGPDTVCGTMYLAALRAGEEMARRVGDDHAADEYRRVRESGRKLTDDRLFNGEYYFQEIPPGVDAAYQYGEGCICDQVLGQWHARILGLGDILDPINVRSALAAVFRHNFRDGFRDHHNPHRVYALNDDKGLLICTWPRGRRPERSLTYAFECMVGFEYQVGAHMIYEGLLREGLTVCKAIRDRHDGARRNPYDEFECGSHYARSMSNYSYLLALSGFRYSAAEATLHLDPKIRAGDFACFFSVESGWGVVRHRYEEGRPVLAVEVREGKLRVDRAYVGGTELTPDEAVAVPTRPITLTVEGAS